MVSDNLDALRRFRRAMAMVKMETLTLPRMSHRYRPGQCTIVIARQNDRLALSSQAREQLPRRRSRGAVMDQIAQDQKPARPIVGQQVQQPLLDRVHPPQREEATGRTLTQLVSEMEVRDRKPALFLMEKREPAIKNNIVGDRGLTRGKKRHSGTRAAEIIACQRLLQSLCERLRSMGKLPGFVALVAGACLLASCAETPVAAKNSTAPAHVKKVRTTAYCHNEGSGSRNAIGRRLSGGGIMSAASDWSRYPLGTRFKVVETGEEYIIDDYGGALVGTNTIDLYKPSTRAMRRWGTRHVDIQILHWGSEAESLRVLRPRHRARIVRRMIASLEDKKT